MGEYERHIWSDGELITADKLNNIECGVEESTTSSSSSTCTVSILTNGSNLVFDKTANEIFAALDEGLSLIFVRDIDDYEQQIYTLVSMIFPGPDIFPGFDLVAYEDGGWKEFFFIYSEMNDYPTWLNLTE